MKPRRILWLMGLLIFTLTGLAFSQIISAVEDYKGPDGSGDQGGYVVLSLKHAEPGLYQVWRELQISVAVSTDNRIATLATPRHQWVPWAVVDVPVGSGARTIVVPALDNFETRWTIIPWPDIAKGATVTDDRAQEELALLGVYSTTKQTEMEKILGQAYDIRAGDQKILLGQLDLSYLWGIATRTAVIKFEPTEKIIKPIRAMDNLPPAAATGEQVSVKPKSREVTLTWMASTDDHPVGFIPYKGYAVPIPGVRTYDIYRGTDEQNLQYVASPTAGATTFQDVIPSDFVSNRITYRVDAADLDNITKGQLISVNLKQPDNVLTDDRRFLETLDAVKTPSEFVLNQNFPNPFNPETQIPYTLASAADTKLVIYNTLGQVVRTLVNERQAAGRYSYQWDGKDSQGHKVASGMYIYRLIAEKFNSVKKLMLLE